MRKNGFTLIELLAVIVILAIIALIATPIILGIINDAREKANERSVELYASAVRNGIAAYQLVEGKEVTAGTYTKETLPFEVEYDGKVDCTSIILSEDSKVSLKGCKVNGGEKTYNYGIEETPSLAGTMGICNPITIAEEGKYTAGDKYECDVDPNKEGYDYIFYVLNADETSVNLIMDSNINISGEAVKTVDMEDKGLVAWINNEHFLEVGGDQTDWDNSENLKVYGPITAMEHLQTATAGWTNAKSLTISTFNDDNGNTYLMAKTYTANARMPYYSEVSSSNGTNEYLYEHLDDSWWNGVGAQPINKVSGLNGYWTLSFFNDEYSAWYVCFEGLVIYEGLNVIQDDCNGVRPVINLSI